MNADPLVLLIDDEPDVHELIDDLLEPEGYGCRHALGGAEALRLLEECTPDLILLDLMMPGMNGFDFAQALARRGLAARVPILVVTALDGIGYQPDVLAGVPGARAVVGKPFLGDSLLRSIRDLLETRPAGASVASCEGAAERGPSGWQPMGPVPMGAAAQPAEGGCPA